MAFDKQLYRQRRNTGQRGQDTPLTSVTVDYSKELNEKTGKPKYKPNFGEVRETKRRRTVNRLFTKKGYTRVLKKEDDGTFTNIPTKKGSRIDKIAHRNTKKSPK